MSSLLSSFLRSNWKIFELQTKILHILTIAFRLIIHNCIWNLKYSSNDVQQDYVAKKKNNFG